MRTIPALVCALFVALAAAPGIAADGTVDVTLRIGDHYHLLPAATTCALAVPAGANAGDVLDAAVATGCIASWSYETFEGFGRYVTEIDGRAQGGSHYWVFAENGATTSYGIDSATAEAGDVFDFRYGTLASFFLP